jgi:hypothetical protein
VGTLAIVLCRTDGLEVLRANCHCDAERVEHLHIDGLLVQIDEVHFFTDLLHGSFGAEGSDIRADVTMWQLNLQKNCVKLVLKMK